ncbi:FadR family transcriptional regulator [Alkalihalobacillus oceani]|uniref:FadR family transcriptional regulator n=1 Tax=Halalkalibacter oceani TaxID=1653776 RepID=A0A9X2DPY1_9BACI|nr:FadR family transcriptional regulator [Halalkalibacter oceani]
MSITPIRRQKIYEEIVQQIYQLIRRGDYKEGDKLPAEGKLAEEFGVSKTVVREAMSVLKASGVVESRSGSGNFIRKLEGETFVQSIGPSLLNIQSLIEILELRRALEIEAASLAADRATEEDIELLKEYNRKLASSEKLEERVENDFLFHKTLFYATHNSAFIKVFDSISSLFKSGIEESKKQSSNLPNRHKEGVEEHFTIMEAISEKDEKKARATMREHLKNNEWKTWKIKMKEDE